MSESPSARAWRGIAAILLSAACFGSLSTLFKLAMATGAALDQLMAIRFAAGALLLALLGGGLRGLRRARAQGALVPLVLMGGLFQAGVTFLSLSSLRWLTPSALAFVFFTYPAWIALLSAILKEEALTGPRLLALALAFSGVAVMVGVPSAGGMPLPGFLLALASAVMYAVYVRLIGKYQAGVSPASGSALIAAGAAAAFLLAALRGGKLVHPLAPAAWGYLALMALVCTVAAFSLFLTGIAILGPVRTAIVGLAEPFFTTLLAAAVLGDAVRPAALLGGTLVVAGVLVQKLLDRPPAVTSPVP